jgi:hypothetical protein
MEPSRKRRRAAGGRIASATAFALVASLAAACSGTARQPLPPPAAPGTPPVAGATAEEPPSALPGLDHLLELPGSSVTFHYSPEALDRAAHLQLRLETLAALLRSLAARQAVYEVWVLSREDWATARLEVPYGLPARVASASFAAPAWGDAAMVAELERRLGGPLPALGAVPLRGTAEEGAALVLADRLLQVEIARDFVARAGVVGDEPWIAPLLAHLLARVAFERFEPGRMPEIAAAFDRLAAAHGEARAHRLADYREGLPLDTDLWFQAQLLRGADVIWVEEGPHGAARWLYRLIDKAKPVEREALEKRYPALAPWRAESFSP